ncbi:MAG: DUF4384 domain-containing protein [Alphaproteobacteria bacterium]|nr:DUF4384 domain-containing protein [Alphaproteobacteria bacterium]
MRLWLLFALLLAVPAWADSESRTAIAEADGQMAVGDDTPLGRARDTARNMAIQRAAEKIGAHLKSFTRVKDLEFDIQVVETSNAARYRILEEKDLGLGTDRIYRFWVKGEFVVRLQDANSERVQRALQSAEAPLSLKLWTERKTYRAGETIVVRMQGNKPFFGTILYRDVSGDTVQLLPNRFRYANFFPGGAPVQVPDRGDQFELKVQPPFGVEQLRVYASTCPLGDIGGKEIEGGMKMVTVDQKDLGLRMRGIGVVKAAPQQAGAAPQASAAPCDRPAEFFEAVWEITTRP